MCYYLKQTPAYGKAGHDYGNHRHQLYKYVKPSESMKYITPGIAKLRAALPAGTEILFWDERFTSTLAHRAMLDGGMRKSRRRDKAIVDEMAATIILNDYLQSKSYNR